MDDTLFKRALECVLRQMLPELVDMLAPELKKHIDAACAGTTTYHRKRPKIDDTVAEKFNGRNVVELARNLGVSRQAVYRSIARQREKMGKKKM